MNSHISANVHKHKSTRGVVEDYLIVDILCDGHEIGHISTSDRLECQPFCPGWIIRAHSAKPVTGFTLTELHVGQLFINNEPVPYDDDSMILNPETIE